MKELYVVENSSEYVEAGRIEYTTSERRSLPVDSKEAAEEMVIEVLREFVKRSLPS